MKRYDCLNKNVWVLDGTVTVCRIQQYLGADCSIIEHQPQRKIGLQQLSTATGGHRAGQWVTIADVVWTAYQTNGANLQPGSEEPYRSAWTEHTSGPSTSGTWRVCQWRGRNVVGRRCIARQRWAPTADVNVAKKNLKLVRFWKDEHWTICTQSTCFLHYLTIIYTAYFSQPQSKTFFSAVAAHVAYFVTYATSQVYTQASIKCSGWTTSYRQTSSFCAPLILINNVIIYRSVTSLRQILQLHSSKCWSIEQILSLEMWRVWLCNRHLKFFVWAR